MTDKTIRRAPYTFLVYLTDWGWKASGRHDTQGDLYLLESHEHQPPLTDEQDKALWHLIDEAIFGRKADAEKAVREWLKAAPAVAKNAA